MKEMTEISTVGLLQGLQRSHSSADSGDGTTFSYAKTACLK